MGIFKLEGSNMVPQRGKILISTPFLRDFYFNRSVILLIQHNTESSIGIILNEKINNNISLNDVLPDIIFNVHIPLFYGGPMKTNSIFLIHTLNFIEDSIPISNGIYLNGDLESIIDYISKGNPINGFIRFFCGHAGWMPGQLEDEINKDSWIVCTCSDDIIMNEKRDDMWKYCMNSIGGICKIWSRFPSDLFLN